MAGERIRGVAVVTGASSDVAECIRSVVADRPAHVNIDQLVVLGRDQAGARQIHCRTGDER